MKNVASALPRLYSVEEVADLLGVSERTVRRWIDKKEVRVHRLGGLIRISEPDLADFLQSRRS